MCNDLVCVLISQCLCKVPETQKDRLWWLLQRRERVVQKNGAILRVTQDSFDHTQQDEFQFKVSGPPDVSLLSSLLRSFLDFITIDCDIIDHLSPFIILKKRIVTYSPGLSLDGAEICIASSHSKIILMIFFNQSRYQI